MSNAKRRAAQQMTGDGIKRLPFWSKGKRVGCATMQTKLPRVHCEHDGCDKAAGYSTPAGNRCFTHARATGAAS